MGSDQALSIVSAECHLYICRHQQVFLSSLKLAIWTQIKMSGITWCGSRQTSLGEVCLISVNGRETFMQAPKSVPYGRCVRVMQAFDDHGFHPIPILSEAIPAGSTGVVREGPYTSGLFDYSLECPVQLDSWEDEGSRGMKTIGIPRGFLELIN